MKKITTILVVTCLLIFLSITSQASHFMGGSINFESVATVRDPVTNKMVAQTVLIRLTLYRDCSGMAFATQETVNFTPAVKTFPNGTITSLVLNQVSIRDASPVCAGEVSTCNPSPTVTYGVQEIVYEGTVNVDLTSPHASFIDIYYGSCCRNGAITNGGSNASWYINSLWNPNFENSSPEYTNMPIFFHCMCEPFTYNPFAIDAEGDSLVFSMADPMEFKNVSVKFEPGFSGNNPLSSNCPKVFDQSSGSLSMGPGKQENGIYSYKIEEYRNGVKISQIIRDVQVQVLNCFNIYPQFTQTTCPTAPLPGCDQEPLLCDIEVCPNDTLTLNVVASDVDSNNVTITMGSLPPGATFTPKVSVTPYLKEGTLQWVPNYSDTAKTYSVFIKAEDDGCPIKGQTVFTYRIKCVTCVVLPIELLAFTGYNDDNDNILEWKTATEFNTDYFIVERLENNAYQEIGIRKAAGNSVAENKYSFTDGNSQNAISYYRLKIVDFDKSFQYSNVISIINPNVTFGLLKTYPVPAMDKLTVDYVSKKEGVTLKVSDVTGRILNTINVNADEGNNSININTTELRIGIYFIEILNANNQKINTKFIKY